MLDTEEYFHLAISASQQKDHHAALGYLKQALEIDPNDARCIFLLAAEHAELGLFDRAIEGMEKAVELDPGLEMAWYQLGLLYIKIGETLKSMSAWQHLSDNAQDDAIRLTAMGLLVVDDDHARGVELLAQAAEADTLNEFVKTSVTTIYKDIDEITGTLAEASQQEVSDEGDVEPAQQSVHSAMLSVYNNPKFTEDDA